MRTDWEALSSFALNSVRLFWLRQVMFLGATIGTSLLLESLLPALCYAICLLMEVAELVTGRAILRLTKHDPSIIQSCERTEVLIGGLSALAVVSFAAVVASMEPGAFHFISFFYMYVAALYAAMFNHMIKPVLVTRIAIYASGLVLLSLWEVLNDWPVVETEALVQLIAMVSGAVFLVWNSNEFLISYANRRRDLRELEARQKRFEDFAGAASDIFFETDSALKIIFLSPQLRERAASLHVPIVDRPVDSLGKVFSTGANSLLREMHTKTSFRDLEVTMEIEPGQTAEMRISGQPIEDSDGHFAGYRCSLRDVSAIIQSARHAQSLTAQLHHSERLRSLGELTSGVAHDFNNILYVIQGNLEIALQTDAENLDPETQAMLADAHAATLRGGAITRDLLALGQTAPNGTCACLIDATMAIVGLMRNAFRSTIALETDLPADAEPGRYCVDLDPTMLEHAILNIALNARDAITGPGTITVRVRREAPSSSEEPARLFVEVTDDGKGMTPEVLQRATDPYFSTKAYKRGSGIGLSVVRRFVEQAGGDIALESEPGKGTTVRLAFDEAAEPRHLEIEDAANVRSGNGERILVVEDDPAVLALMQSMLLRLGYSTISAASATEAWAKIKGGLKIAAVVTDVDMPGEFDGADLARRLELRDPDLPVLVVSGYDLTAIATAGWQSPRRFHQKPIGLPVLSKALGELLETTPQETLKSA